MCRSTTSTSRAAPAGTRFDLGFTVQPKKGKAVIWPATHNDRPFEQDERTHHEALPVTKGIKYAANFWIHQPPARFKRRRRSSSGGRCLACRRRPATTGPSRQLHCHGRTQVRLRHGTSPGLHGMS